MFQKIVNFILNVFGYAYIWIEQFKHYPDDHTILGMVIDDDLYRMSRKQLCRYMDAVLPEVGFFDLQSTSKIRLGCQLLRDNHNLMRKKPRRVVLTQKDIKKFVYEYPNNFELGSVIRGLANVKEMNGVQKNE